MTATTDPKADALLVAAAEKIIRARPGLSTPAIARAIGCDGPHLYRLLCADRRVQPLPDQGALTYWGPAEDSSP